MNLDTKELKTITVLYVEDDAIVREQTMSVLEKMFKKVFVAFDGQNGLEVFKKNKHLIDVVVSDINMPKMNGLEMIKNINSFNSSIATIVTTAHTDSNFLIDAIDINVDKFIAKPILIKDLTISIVNAVLKYRRLNNIENLAKNLVTKSTQVDDINSDLNKKVEFYEKEIKYYKALVDTFVVNFKIDKNGNITEGSDKFFRFFEFIKDDIIGKNITMLQCESCNQESFQKLMLKAIHSKKSVVSTYLFKRYESNSIECDITLTPVYNNESLVNGYMIYLDVLD